MRYQQRERSRFPEGRSLSTRSTRGSVSARFPSRECHHRAAIDRQLIISHQLIDSPLRANSRFCCNVRQTVESPECFEQEMERCDCVFCRDPSGTRARDEMGQIHWARQGRSGPNRAPGSPGLKFMFLRQGPTRGPPAIKAPPLVNCISKPLMRSMHCRRLRMPRNETRWKTLEALAAIC